MEKQLVIFELAGENYGLDISTVESIIKMQEITVIPHAPRFVEGVTNLRGKVLPVIDLRKRLHLPARQPDKNSRIIVISISEQYVGMIVDAVLEVMTIDGEIVEPPPDLITSANTLFITGIAKTESRLVILLDLCEVLSQEEKGHLTSLSSEAA